MASAMILPFDRKRVGSLVCMWIACIVLCMPVCCILPTLRPTVGLNRCTLYSSSKGGCREAETAAITAIAVV